MKCLYYLSVGPASTLDSAHRIADDLHAIGVSDFFLHVISHDEAGLQQQHLHGGNWLETRDLIRDGFIGSGIGFMAGWVGVGLLELFEPFGPNLPSVVYAATIAAATLFGAWDGGLTGFATENRKLVPFHDDLEAGRYLVLIYSRDHQELAVRDVMRSRHPEAALAAVDRHFLNPFTAVRRRGAESPACLSSSVGGLLQED